MNKQETVAVIRSLISSVKDTYNVSKLNLDFKKETGVDIPLFGFSNLSDFLQSIPDTVKVTGIYPAQQIHLVKNEKSSHIVNLVKKQRQQKKKTQKKRNQLGKTFWRKTSAEKSTTLVDKQASNKKNNIMAMDKANSKNTMKCKNINKPQVLNSTVNSTGITNCEKIPVSSLINAITSTISLDSCKHCRPFQVLVSLERVAAIDLNSYAKIGNYIEVYPTEIVSPDKFYFQFRKNKKKLIKLTNQLSLFYFLNEKMFSMTAKAIKPNQTCVVLMFSSWHRAEILKVHGDSLVSVFLFDYGITVKTPAKNLRFLCKNFSLLPRQAVLGSLASIKYLEGQNQWSMKATKRFFELAFERDLVAAVIKMDTKSNFMSLVLTSTSGSKEVHINDALVREKLAVYEKQSLATTSPKMTKKAQEVLHRLKYSQEEANFSEDKSLSTSTNKSLDDSRSPIFYSPKNDRLKEIFFQ